LHRAAAYASEETIQFLLDAGADKTIRDANGDSSQSWASWHWRPKSLI
jgi:ankyrin repeat protein